MSSPRRIEWLNENKYRRYPFIEDAMLTGGGVTIPDDVILDFQLTTFRHNSTPVKLVRLEVSELGGIKYGTFRFSYVSGTYPWGDSIEFTVPESASYPYETTTFAASLHTGKVIFGEGIAPFLQATAPGVYNFSTQVEPALIVFQNRHRVESITASDVASPHQTLTGKVQVRAGYNCRVAISSLLNSLTISAIVGAGRGIQCNPPTSVNCNEVLLRVNGLHADDNGNLVLLAGDGMEAIPDRTNHQVILRSVQPKDELICG